jgi:NAD(P)-dependent dehydrogenase (short-subunit alcohol dehydrogenase family)
MVLGHLFSHWTRKDIPHLQGRVAVVTGGNSGIGFEVARHLAQHGAALALVGRKQQLVEWAVEDLLEEFPGADIRPFTCNLEVIKEVQGLSADLLAAYPSIHLLVNNAGRFLDADFATTSEGLEQTMAVNYWGHVALTTLLLDRWGGGSAGEWQGLMWKTADRCHLQQPLQLCHGATSCLVTCRRQHC